MSVRLYVGNLSFQTTDADLQQAFAGAGQVVSASVVTDRDTGRSRGFGFVEMESKEAADAAIEMWNGKDLGGRELTVNEARPKEAGGPRRSFGGGGYGNNSRGGFGGRRNDDRSRGGNDNY